MGSLHRLPTRLLEKPGLPTTGFCMECGTEQPWPRTSREWPETCVCGCTPLVLASYRITGDTHVITDGAGQIVGVISPT